MANLLRRVGNKSRIAGLVQSHFPPHNIYIELFFGAGGLFFNKPLASYNILNDIDNDVYNLFFVLREQKEALISAITDMPVHQSLFNYWLKNDEAEPLYKAVRFLMLSNFSLYGKSNTFKVEASNTKRIILSSIEATFLKIQDACFLNCDFREALKKISKRDVLNQNSFIYCDPTYLGTGHNYDCFPFTEQDSSDLFDVLVGSGCRFAYSEFNHPFILEQAAARGLRVIPLVSRIAIKSFRYEIMVVNYDIAEKLF